jgi:hypothetical protein
MVETPGSKIRGIRPFLFSPPSPSISSPHERGRTEVGGFLFGEGTKGRVKYPALMLITPT